MADQTYTLGALKVKRLGNNGRNPFTHKCIVDFADVNGTNAGGTWTTDGDTVTITLMATPADWAVTAAAVNISTAFATDGTLTYELGTDGDTDNFLTATDALTAAPEIAAAGAVPVTLAGSFGAASDNLVIRFTTQAATGAPADITAGRAEIFLSLVAFNELDQGAP